MCERHGSGIVLIVELAHFYLERPEEGGQWEEDREEAEGGWEQRVGTKSGYKECVGERRLLAEPTDNDKCAFSLYLNALPLVHATDQSELLFTEIF